MAGELTREIVDKEIGRLEKMLKARTGKPGFGENVVEIQARLDAVKQERESLEPEPDPPE